jgi:hypothetical protein
MEGRHLGLSLILVRRILRRIDNKQNASRKDRGLKR